jgi:histidyl-tRNA synthetase
MFKRVRGTEDILDLALHNFILETFKKHINAYNFSQIQTPILEPTNLFIRSLGEETDVVTKEMYTFQTSTDESICLRPEATASTMRAFIEAKPTPLPWKVFSYGPMFRHERPQKGRWRQFSQINMEIIGSNAIAQDANFIKMIDHFFNEKLNLENYILKINFLGTKNDREVYKKKLYTFLKKVDKSICNTCKIRKEKNILRVFDCKKKECKEAYLKAPKIIDSLSKTSTQEWENLQDLLAILSVNFVVDPTLVRGLDYYNKTVFEFSSNELGAQDAFCGGGRYDDLAEELGSKEKFPSIGASIGMGRLLMLIEKMKDKLPLSQKPALHVIIPMSEQQQSLALLLADNMQAENICTDVILDEGSMKSMMRKANKMQANFVLILGEEEQKTNTVTIKDMQTGESQNIKQAKVVSFLKK